MDSYLLKLQHAIASATSGMTDEELTRHPEAKWNAAQVLEHLYLSYVGTVKGCERCLKENRPFTRAQTLKDRLSVAIVVTLGYMPTGRQAPEVARPRGLPCDEVTKGIGPQIAAMDTLLTRCEEHFGKRAKFMAHPILGPLNAAQWRKLHWVHGQHHLKQISQLRSNV